jgi:predicted DNA-binding protein
MKWMYNIEYDSKIGKTIMSRKKPKFIAMSFTLEEKARDILDAEQDRTGKNKSFIIRELIWNLAKNNEAA